MDAVGSEKTVRKIGRMLLRFTVLSLKSRVERSKK
jgi:hypothetical protein